jgi:hypothetical protein
MDPVWDGLPEAVTEHPNNVSNAVRFWVGQIEVLENRLETIENKLNEKKCYKLAFGKYATFFVNVLEEGMLRAQGKPERDIWNVNKVPNYSIEHPLDVKKEKDRVDFFAAQVVRLRLYKPKEPKFEERLKTSMQVLREMKYIIDQCANQDNTFDIEKYPYAFEIDKHSDLLIRMKGLQAYHNSRHDDNHLFTMEMGKTHEKLEMLERIDPEAFQECRHYTFVEDLQSTCLKSKMNEALFDNLESQTRAELHRRIERIEDQRCIWQKIKETQEKRNEEIMKKLPPSGRFRYAPWNQPPASPAVEFGKQMFERYFV